MSSQTLVDLFQTIGLWALWVMFGVHVLEDYNRKKLH